MYQAITDLRYTVIIMSVPLAAGQVDGLASSNSSSKSITMYGGVAIVGFAASMYGYKFLRSYRAKRKQDTLQAILLQETPLPKAVCDLVSEYANSSPIKLPFQLARNLFYSESTMKCDCYMVSPVGVIITHAPDDMQKPKWKSNLAVRLKAGDAENIQLVVDAFSNVNSDIWIRSFLISMIE